MPLKILRLILLSLLMAEAGLLIFGPQTKDHLPEIEKALAAQDKPEWWDDAAMGIRYAAWAGVSVMGGLLLTSGFWGRGFVGAAGGAGAVRKVESPVWFWPLLGVAVLAGLGMRLPMASKSLWWDESWVMIQASHGKWKADAKQPDKFKFQAHDWKRCAFYYQKPTNHAPMSLAQKTSLNGWRMVTGAPREAFSDLAARGPALVASCVAVLLLGGLLRSWGRPGVGVSAAFGLALHPWAVRYGVDARAYALVIPLCISAMWAATCIIRGGGRRLWPWVWFGLTEFLWLWAYPTDVIVVALLNGVIGVLVVLQHREVRDRWTVLGRFVVMNVVAALCFIHMFLPNLVQARRWAGNETVVQPFTYGLLKSTLSQAILGVEYGWGAGPETAGLVSSQAGVGTLGITYGIAVPIILGSLLVLGIFNQRPPAPRPSERRFHFILLWPILGAVLFTLATIALGSYYYPRFIIACLPCLIATCCWTMEGRWKEPFDYIRRFFVTAIVCAAAPFWIAQNRVFATRPYAPLHDVAAFVQMDSAQRPDKEPIICCYGLGREVLPLYERRCVSVVTLDEVKKLVVQAKAEQRPLYAIYGYNTFNRLMVPEGFQLLDDPTVFAEAAAFPAIDPEFYFRVLKLVPGSL